MKNIDKTIRVSLKLLLLMLCFGIYLGFFSSNSFAGKISLVTYYPAPHADFDRIRLIPHALSNPCQIGALAVDSSTGNILYCNNVLTVGIWKPLSSVWTESGQSTYPTPTLTDPSLKVGIGTSTPSMKLTLDNDGGIIALGTFGAGATFSTFQDSHTLTPGFATAPRFVWYPRKAALHIVDDSDGNTVNAKIGNYSVAFGTNNYTPSEYSTIAGFNSSIGRSVEGKYGLIAGGALNSCQDYYCAILGGVSNSAGGYSVISGVSNTGPTNVYNTTISGGSNNRITAAGNVISGGENNSIASAGYAVISGGYDNAMLGDASFVCPPGYWCAPPSANYSVISGGKGNRSVKNFGTIAGGVNNSIKGEYGYIGGGEANNNSGGSYSVIGGGYNNNNSGTYSTITGGLSNTISIIGSYPYSRSTILGGTSNNVSGDYSGIGGGANNTISGYASVIAGGLNNTVSAAYSFAAGRNMNLSNTASRTFAWGYSDTPVNITSPDSFIIAPGTNGASFYNPKVGIRETSLTAILNITGSGSEDYLVVASALKVNSNGFLGIGNSYPNHPLEFGAIANNARLTAGGVWTSTCSREFKQNINPLSAAEAIDALNKLDAVTYNYKNSPTEHHVGFIAEDVPELVSVMDRNGVDTMGVAAVITGVLKNQKNQITEQKAFLTDFRAEVTKFKNHVKKSISDKTHLQ